MSNFSYIDRLRFQKSMPHIFEQAMAVARDRGKRAITVTHKHMEGGEDAPHHMTVAATHAHAEEAYKHAATLAPSQEYKKHCKKQAEGHSAMAEAASGRALSHDKTPSTKVDLDKSLQKARSIRTVSFEHLESTGHAPKAYVTPEGHDTHAIAPTKAQRQPRDPHKFQEKDLAAHASDPEIQMHKEKHAAHLEEHAKTGRDEDKHFAAYHDSKRKELEHHTAMEHRTHDEDWEGERHHAKKAKGHRSDAHASLYAAAGSKMARLKAEHVAKPDHRKLPRRRVFQPGSKVTKAFPVIDASYEVHVNRNGQWYYGVTQ